MSVRQLLNQSAKHIMLILGKAPRKQEEKVNPVPGPGAYANTSSFSTSPSVKLYC